jgi:predicted NUDIX family phosphoesterase
MTEEQVLVVPTKVYNPPDGITSDVRAIWRLMQEASLMPRAAAEGDPTFKQLIPYIILVHEHSIFTYWRKGQEQRLHGLKSLGIGGHLNDANILAGVGRELHEEVYIPTRYMLSFNGFINDNTTPVGQVHLGLFFIAILEKPKVRPRDETGGGQFEPWSNLIPSEFELWSQHVLRFGT